MKYTDEIGLLVNNVSWDNTTDLNITTKPFQIAPIAQTPNVPSTQQSYGVWTIKNGPNYGVQLAVSLSGELFTRGQNVGIWGPWKQYSST
ncbi:MAG: hypothetical protein ACRC54_04975 [Fusobacteriaceae bacterium]